MEWEDSVSTVGTQVVSGTLDTTGTVFRHLYIIDIYSM